MGKIAFMFPGQGAQYTGMGRDFYEQFDIAKNIYDLAGTAAGLDVKTLCFEENEQLNITEFTQIAMLATEVAILKVVQSKGLKADVCAGLSLGEYAAIAASEVMDPVDYFRIVRKRGIYMQKAYPEGGAMTAVLGCDIATIERICEEVVKECREAGDSLNTVSIANYNCPGQIVITGTESAVQTAAERLKDNGAKRCIPLKVSGPFHSALLENAGNQLAEDLQGVNLHKPSIPYFCNVDASMITEADHVKELLAKQVCSSVRWQQCVENMIAYGVDTFIEIGPGKTLTGFMKKINPEVKVYQIDKVEDMNRVLEELSC